jgi:hypothetical protein
MDNSIAASKDQIQIRIKDDKYAPLAYKMLLLKGKTTFFQVAFS